MTQMMLNTTPPVRTTITLPADLLRRSQEWVDSGIVPNRNALFVTAIEHFLAELERAEIDRQFAAIAEDEAYQRLNETISGEFAVSDWETLRVGEQSL